MHIPDGYLSPSTCAALYAAAAPFWAVAMRRLRSLIRTRALPLLALFASFSFVVQMFNIPLPGGTTGHAIGVTIAAIVLGPWGAIIAASIALTIQAFFFGDGGLTALGANCFNIAIAGSFVGWGTYKVLSGSSVASSKRRVVAAAAAGYMAVNVAALLTAIEFGIQPHLFRDATGMPLYAPYPLAIAVPAMMLGHLTIAGLAEALFTAGLVSWLQASEPSLLDGGARLTPVPHTATSPLWAVLALMLLMTPLGLLAAGSAWGEWSADDFSDTRGRDEIARSSLGVPPPEIAPSGIRRLSSVWTAPMSDYAPSFMRDHRFGYVLSGMFGTGLILASTLIFTPMLRRDSIATGDRETH